MTCLIECCIHSSETTQGDTVLAVDDLFMCGNHEFDERVLKRLRKDYPIGSEEIDDVAFVGPAHSVGQG